MSSSQLMGLSPEEIAPKLRRGELAMAVIGLGWMGLPMACLFADAGVRVVGVDVNARIVEKVNKGEPPIDEKDLPQVLKRAVRTGKLKATANTGEAVAESDVITIVVPTSIDHQKKADYQAVEDASRDIGKSMRSGTLVVFQSTCGPGVTERIVKLNLEKYSGLKGGETFGLAYSPIRAMSGRALRDIQTYQKVVGGLDKKSLDAACAVFSVIVKGELVRVHDIKTAEASKLFEAIYRDVNIALSNEFAMLCEQIGIDYMETMRAANSQPYSHLHIPGVGVGGHCLPVYPYLLASEVEGFEMKPKLVMESRRINEQMPRHVARLTADGLRACGKTLKRARITVLGIGFRANVKEARFSPALELIGVLKRRGARVMVYDPKYTSSEVTRLGYNTEPTLRRAVEKADCVIITVAHDEFKELDVIDLGAHMSKPSVIVDCAHILNPREVEKSGIIYRGVGRGLWTK